MIAALGMYDMGANAPVNDRLWALIRDALRDAGREPILSSAISRMGVALKKYSVKPGVSYTSLR